jgi:transposase
MTIPFLFQGDIGQFHKATEPVLGWRIASWKVLQLITSFFYLPPYPMNQRANVVGIEVSKGSLAVCYQVANKLQHTEVSHSRAGFQQLIRRCGVACCYVMEATGVYYLSLAYYLVEQGAQVAVLNPLVVRRFIQMHLGKGKSDRKDAQWLLRYGQQQPLPVWQPEAPLLVECRQLEQVMEQFIRQRTRVSNSLQGLEHQPIVSAVARKRLQQTLKLLDQQIHALEAELLALLEEHYAREMPLLCSIPGIGRKTAAQLLLFAKGFTQVQNYRQLVAKAGLCPREYSSGSSVRGKTRITHMGGGLIRSKLFLCRFAAKQSNAACKALYDRLVAKGKKGKVALVAVCNKLLQQACAIVQSGIPYLAGFSSKLVPSP